MAERAKTLTQIVRAKEWTNENLEKLMVFCILDTQQLYSKVVQCYDALDRAGLVTRSQLSESTPGKIEKVLRSAGCRFPRQKSKYIHHFGTTNFDLSTASRPMLCGYVKGVGMKLASMFLNETRGTEYAIIDVHIKRFLDENDRSRNGYFDEEFEFMGLAKMFNMSVRELDAMIWEAYRVK